MKVNGRSIEHWLRAPRDRRVMKYNNVHKCGIADPAGRSILNGHTAIQGVSISFEKQTSVFAKTLHN
jgi:hypothetical protein